MNSFVLKCFPLIYCHQLSVALTLNDLDVVVVTLLFNISLKIRITWVFCAAGGNAEFAVVCEDLVMHVPENMSFTDAAAIPEVWLTSFQLVHLVGENYYYYYYYYYY